MSNKDPVLIIDAYGFVFRAYYVQKNLTTKDGLPIGALYGFTSMLLKVIEDFKPKYAIVVFDPGGKNFRHQIYDKYKANRPPAPQDLIDQLVLVRTAAKSLNFATLEKTGYEADDVIATLVTKLSLNNTKSIVISADKDLMQLMSENVTIFDPIKAKYLTQDDIVDKFGTESPDKIKQILSLMGDKADNIPGATGIGPKTASELIKKFGSVDSLLTNIEQIENARIREIIRRSQSDIKTSLQLVALDCNVELDLDFESFKWIKPNTELISNFLNQYEFKSLHKRAEKLFDLKISSNKSVEVISISRITSDEELSVLLTQAKLEGVLSIYAIHHKDKFCGLIISVKEARGFIEKLELLPQLIKTLKDDSIKKITYDLKAILHLCDDEFFTDSSIASFDDLELMQYLLSAGKEYRQLFDFKHDSEENLISISEKVVENFYDIYEKLAKSLREEKLFSLYRDIELPLSYVIYKMEKNGIKVDQNYLKQLSNNFGNEIAILERDIFAIAGIRFNIASPKQLAEILFEKLQLPFAKKSTKTKQYSTSVDILEKLSVTGYQIADFLLKWRQLTKLKNTYTDSLPNHISVSDGRIHTTFLQTSTSTGRLSSLEPNLQNIPIRSEAGNQIRAAFVAKDGCKLLSVDYSQIELRILSHIADIPEMKQAFILGEDIHSQTACDIFKILPSELNKEHRRKAKAINFGIIYGISNFGLANQLGIPSQEAAKYIQEYFVRYPNIEKYMQSTKDFAKEHLYVKTLFGRKCFVPTINDTNFNIRQFAERAAINAPIQGTSADIIKIAMINIDKMLQKQSFKTKLILQIHDELLFEIPENELNEVSVSIKSIMQNVPFINIPIIVETKIGNNWMETH